MAKLFKKLLGAAAVGTAAAGALYYWKKNRIDTDEFEDDFEDDDFDLDDDLKPVTDREYVSLNSAPKSEESSDTDVEEADGPSEEVKESSPAEDADKEAGKTE
ncbi:hypothetical protein AALA78_09180 [Lachnospiraceae bacterium 42-17]|jgi:hypothetical protein|nr:hypothetical protein [Dorea sp.]